MGTFTQALAIALAAGAPALIWAIYRGRKLGPKEEEDLVSRSASQAVETMSAVLDAARRERKDLLDRLKSAEELAKRRGGELVDVRAEAHAAQRKCEECARKTTACETRIADLEGQVARLRARPR